MKTLASYVRGTWTAGKGSAQALVNPATEETLAEVSTEGIDFAETLAYARNVGGPALRAMTFRERGGLLRAMSRAIHAQRDHLIDIGIANGGNTRGDAKFDIDGASGTLSYYADLADKLGDQKFILEGDYEQLARSPRFVGAHVVLPRRGVAVHVNAFNFPAWGLGEKAACAILAGMPVVSKPATSTALLAHRIVELIVEASLLPAGVLSLVAGPPGDLLKHLRGEDVLSFTGGGSTAVTLRSLEAVVRDSVKVNVEADSLNGAILGRDVEPGSDTYNAFLRDVSRDMTQKTGQKCTAIRRVFVSRDQLERVQEDLAERLTGVIVGNPANEKVTMGPLATKAQHRDIQKGIELLASECKQITGKGDFARVDVPEGKGFFVPPTLFVQEKPGEAKVVHAHEVFGPVQTLMAYQTTEELIDWVRLGNGGLVTSGYTDDRAFAAELVMGIGSAHGRLTLGSAKIAEQAPGPGTVLPQLIHGGPGRAGGGEELGGERGLRFYSQRTAVQGDKPMLESILGKKA